MILLYKWKELVNHVVCEQAQLVFEIKLNE